MPAIKKSEACAECQEQAPRVRKGKRFKVCEDCRRVLTTNKWKVRKAKRTLREGSLVEYNDGTGWRAGYLLKMRETRADVQPIGARGKVPDVISASITDIKETAQSPSMPTVADYLAKNAPVAKKVVVLVAGPTFTVQVAAAIKDLAPTIEILQNVVPEPEMVATGFGWRSAMPKAKVQDTFDLPQSDPLEGHVPRVTPKETLAMDKPPKAGKSGHSKFPPLVPADIIKEYQAGVTMGAIVKARNDRGNAIRKLLREAGVYKKTR